MKCRPLKCGINLPSVRRVVSGSLWSQSGPVCPENKSRHSSLSRFHTNWLESGRYVLDLSESSVQYCYLLFKNNCQNIIHKQCLWGVGWGAPCMICKHMKNPDKPITMIFQRLTLEIWWPWPLSGNKSVEQINAFFCLWHHWPCLAVEIVKLWGPELVGCIRSVLHRNEREKQREMEGNWNFSTDWGAI